MQTLRVTIGPRLVLGLLLTVTIVLACAWALRERISDGNTRTQNREDGSSPDRLEVALADQYAHLERWRATDDKPQIAWTLKEIGNLHSQLGANDTALECYAEALTIAQDARIPLLEGLLQNNIGTIHSDRGDLDAALQQYGQALSIANDQNDSRLRLLALNNSGVVFAKRGQYEHALGFYRAVVTQTDNDDANRDVKAAALINIGQAQANQWLYADALDNLERALDLSRALDDQALVNSALTNIGQVKSQLADDRGALQSYQDALAIAGDIHSPNGQMNALENIGRVLTMQSDIEAALQYYEEALKIAQTQQLRLDEGWIRAQIGDAHLLRDDMAAAQVAYEAAQELARETDNLPLFTRASLHLGDVAARRNEDNEAIALYREALSGAHDLGTGQLERLALHGIGAVLERAGDEVSALAAYRAAINIHEDLRSRPKLLDLRAGEDSDAFTTYAAAIGILVRQGAIADAFELSEHARARAFLDQLTVRVPDPQYPNALQLATEERSLRDELGAIEDEIRSAALAKRTEAANVARQRLEEKRQEHAALLRRIKLTDSSYADLISVQPLSLADIYAQLPPDITLLSYYVTPKATYAFIITQGTLRAESLQIDEDTLRQLVNGARLTPSRPSDPASLTLDILSQLLLTPVQEQIPTTTLAIVPHGPLHYLSFAALPTNTITGRLLIDDHALFVLPSASALSQIHSPRPIAPSQRSLVVAQGYVPGTPTLTDADREADGIADLYAVQPLKGPDARESAVLALSGQADLIHIAAHADLDLRTPMHSRILLSPGDGQDGALEVHELYNLDLRNTRLVVLSACETQLGALSRGDELVGLSRAFLHAGTESVVASLWDVDDAATADLMINFHVQLQTGVGRAEALRRAQLQARKTRPNPWYWAAFELSGNPGPIFPVTQ
jgi:CHAT domain-containing protein